jgi:hypothetical protein
MFNKLLFMKTTSRVNIMMILQLYCLLKKFYLKKMYIGFVFLKSHRFSHQVKELLLQDGEHFHIMVSSVKT